MNRADGIVISETSVLPDMMRSVAPAAVTLIDDAPPLRVTTDSFVNRLVTAMLPVPGVGVGAGAGAGGVTGAAATTVLALTADDAVPRKACTRYHTRRLLSGDASVYDLLDVVAICVKLTPSNDRCTRYDTSVLFAAFHVSATPASLRVAAGAVAARSAAVARSVPDVPDGTPVPLARIRYEYVAPPEMAVSVNVVTFRPTVASVTKLPLPVARCTE
jgi:hypothetical protein